MPSREESKLHQGLPRELELPRNLYTYPPEIEYAGTIKEV